MRGNDPLPFFSQLYKEAFPTGGREGDNQSDILSRKTSLSHSYSQSQQAVAKPSRYNAPSLHEPSSLSHGGSILLTTDGAPHSPSRRHSNNEMSAASDYAAISEFSDNKIRSDRRPTTERRPSCENVHNTPWPLKIGEERRLDLADEVEKYKSLYELKLMVENQKDAEIQALSERLEALMQQHNGQATRFVSGGDQRGSGWDISSLFSSKRNSSGRPSGDDQRYREAEIARLREALEMRSKHIVQLQSQVRGVNSI